MSLNVRVLIEDNKTPKLSDGEVLKKTFNDVELNLNGECFGRGCLYLGTQRLYWVSKDDPFKINFSVDYDVIVLHAVCRDENHWPEPALYSQFDIKFNFNRLLRGICFPVSPKSESLSSDSDENLTEVWFIPQDPSLLSGLFQAITEISSLASANDGKTLEGDFLNATNHSTLCTEDSDNTLDDIFESDSSISI